MFFVFIYFLFNTYAKYNADSRTQINLPACPVS